VTYAKQDADVQWLIAPYSEAARASSKSTAKTKAPEVKQLQALAAIKL